MLRGVVDGVGSAAAAERETHERIRVYAAAHLTVYLVAQGPDVPARLADGRRSNNPSSRRQHDRHQDHHPDSTADRRRVRLRRRPTTLARLELGRHRRTTDRNSRRHGS
jgi:hypothetical protein